MMNTVKNTIKDIGILTGLRNAVMTIEEFNRDLQRRVDGLMADNSNLTKEEAINNICLQSEKKYMSSRK